MNYKAKHLLCIYIKLIKIRNKSFIINPFSDTQSPTDSFTWNPFLTAAWRIDIVKLSMKENNSCIAICISHIEVLRFSRH